MRSITKTEVNLTFTLKVRLPYPDSSLLLACYAKGVMFACAWHGIYLS